MLKVSRWFVLCLCIILIFLSSCGKQQEDIIRGVSWDDSYNEVAEKEKENGSDITLHESFISVEDTLVFNREVEYISYHFDDGQLTSINIHYRKYRDDKLRRDNEYTELRHKLELEYGEPISEEDYSASWSEEGYLMVLSKEKSVDFYYNFIKLSKQ